MKILSLISGFFFAIYSTFQIFTIPSFAYEVPKDYKITVAIFVRNGCQHCKDEEIFLEKLKKEKNDISIRYYKLEDQDDRRIWEKLTTRVGISKITPITVIGNKYLIGFSNQEVTGKKIRELIEDAKNTSTSTDVDNSNLKEAGQKNSTCTEDSSIPCTVDTKQPYYMILPIIGEIDTQKYPLLFISAILGFFDGFNPCAMWALMTFLIILIEVGNRRKMFVFAGTFILAEVLMYSLILTVWYKTWDFVKLDTIITPLIGGISIIGGIFFLSVWRKKEIECKVTNMTQRAKTRQKIQDLATSKFTVLTLLGILGIAFSVNIIEFACSIGIPQAFTKILELNKLSFFQTGLLIIVYIFFYMIDDLFVFGVALYGIDKLALTTRYSKLSNLIGGVVMIILGLILIFKFQVLLF